MDVKNALALQAYGQARQSAAALRPDVEGQAPAASGSLAGNLAASFAETLRAGEETAKAAMVGGADPHSLVQALASSQLAVETAVAVRDRVVEAYQEILRMPV